MMGAVFGCRCEAGSGIRAAAECTRKSSRLAMFQSPFLHTFHTCNTLVGESPVMIAVS